MSAVFRGCVKHGIFENVLQKHFFFRKFPSGRLPCSILAPRPHFFYPAPYSPNNGFSPFWLTPFWIPLPLERVPSQIEAPHRCSRASPAHQLNPSPAASIHDRMSLCFSWLFSGCNFRLRSTWWCEIFSAVFGSPPGSLPSVLQRRFFFLVVPTLLYFFPPLRSSDWRVFFLAAGSPLAYYYFFFCCEPPPSVVSWPLLQKRSRFFLGGRREIAFGWVRSEIKPLLSSPSTPFFCISRRLLSIFRGVHRLDRYPPLPPKRRFLLRFPFPNTPGVAAFCFFLSRGSFHQYFAVRGGGHYSIVELLSSLWLFLQVAPRTKSFFSEHGLLFPA